MDIQKAIEEAGLKPIKSCCGVEHKYCSTDQWQGNLEVFAQQLQNNSMEWQLVDEDNWIFGEKIRGIIRHQKAEIYFDEEWTGREGGWRWMIFGESLTGGYAPSRSAAIYCCELALGFKENEL